MLSHLFWPTKRPKWSAMTDDRPLFATLQGLPTIRFWEISYCKKGSLKRNLNILVLPMNKSMLLSPFIPRFSKKILQKWVLDLRFFVRLWNGSEAYWITAMWNEKTAGHYFPITLHLKRLKCSFLWWFLKEANLSLP